MLAHKLQTKIYKRGYLELKNLPFMEGTQIEIVISKKKRKKNLQKLICNDHVWTEEDIKAVERGREIIETFSKNKKAENLEIIVNRLTKHNVPSTLFSLCVSFSDRPFRSGKKEIS
jgi:hypothetical protein